MISSDVRLSADEDPQTSARAAMMKDRSTWLLAHSPPSDWRLSLTAARPRQRLQARLDGLDVLLDLRNRQPAVKARPGFQVSGKAPAVHPQLLKRLAVFQSRIAVHNQLNRTRHDATPQKQFGSNRMSLVQAERLAQLLRWLLHPGPFDCTAQPSFRQNRSRSLTSWP